LKSCKCKSKTNKIELLGRIDNVLCIGSTNVSLELISEAIKECPELTQNFQLISSKKANLDLLSVQIESRKKIQDRKKLERKFIEIINSKSTEPIINLEVKVFKINKIKRNPKTNKIKRIIDLR